MKRGTRALALVIDKKFCPKSKRSQMKLSFGMIFSIILIIIFLVFAFYAIQKFLKIQDAVKVGQFVEGLQNDIDKMWRGNQGASPINEKNLPKKIEYVCFIDIDSEKSGTDRNFYNELKDFCYNNENMIFYPVGSAQGIESKEIKHIDIAKITEMDNPFCIQNIGGKVEMTIQKNSGEALVEIARS